MELMTIRFGGIAARKRPIGRKAASAFKKSLKLSFPPPLSNVYVRLLLEIDIYYSTKIVIKGLVTKRARQI